MMRSSAAAAGIGLTLVACATLARGQISSDSGSATQNPTIESPATPSPSTQPSRTFEFREGHWPEISAPAAPTTTLAATQPASDPTLDLIESLIEQGHFADARKRCVIWLLANKTSPLRDRGLFLEADALYGYGNRIKAFFYLDELMDEYPESSLFYKALEKQYQIADGYLNGYKRRLLYIPILGAEEEAVEMLYRIQRRSPGSPLAEKSLLRTADFYYSNGDFDLAADAYAAYLRSYPRSNILPRVRLRQAFSNLAQFRGLRFDATPVIDARIQLVSFMNDYPQVARDEAIPQVLQRIDKTFARKLFGVADFYARTHEPGAAVYTYRFLVATYPELPEATEAKERLKQMPQWALDQPEPAAGPIGVPTTSPSTPAEQ
jgi:outer membrane assembly lipoprotein YfiO